MSLDELGKCDLDQHYLRDLDLPLTITEEEIGIPLIESEIQMWDGGDELYPHLHFTCPRCHRMHNTDLEGGDPNPKLACCDSCSWESLVWLSWDEGKAEKLKSKQGVTPSA